MQERFINNIMNAKKTFVLRLNPQKFEAVEKWAADEFRSTNGQLEWIIDQALKKAGRYKNEPQSPDSGDIGQDQEI
jgi:hypothetical protein